MNSLLRFFAGREKLATLMTVMIIMLGISTLMGIKRDIYPVVDFGIVTILTSYPGAAPEDVELNVTNKIEEELTGVTGLDRVTSFSMENVSLITVFIDVDATDQDEVKINIREAVGRVTDLPDDVTESPLITELNSTDQPVIEVGLVGGTSYRELREQARLFEKKLKNVAGVSRLEKYGYRAKEIQVDVSQDAVERYQIPMREIIDAIRYRNIRSTGGSFESYTSEKDVVTLAQFEDPMEVGDVIVRSTFDGLYIRVNDLAEIRDGFEDETVLSRINGQEGISFVVFPDETADIIRLCDNVKDLITKQNPHLPDGIKLLYSNDSSNVVRDSFDVVLKNGALGLILVAIVLALFLNIRTAFWVAMGIPVAFLGTIFLLPLFDGYMDTITLTGMILVIGIIVDDAIVIAENISRKRELGASPLDAAVEGTHEVFPPVVATVLTTFLVFAPMFFMPGIFGKFIFAIPLAISLALFISLGEALIALPAHLVSGLRKIDNKKPKKNRFDRLRTLFSRTLLPLLKFRYVLLTLFIIALSGSLWYAANNIKFILFPSATAQQFFLIMELPTGTPLHTTSEKVKTVEQLISSLPKEELDSFSSRIGENLLINAKSENYAALIVVLSPYTERVRTADEIVDELRSVTDTLTGFEKVSYSINTGGPPVGKPISIRVTGSNDSLRALLTDSVEVLLGTINGVKDISRNDKTGKDQVQVKIDYDNLSRLDLSVADVAQNVRLAYDGEVVTSVRYGDEEVDFRVRVSGDSRKQLSNLNDLLIPNRQGRLIRLREVATLKSGPGTADYRHYDGERTITISADLDQDVITPVEVIHTVISHFDLNSNWPGMQLEQGGEAVETDKSMASLFHTMIIAIVAVYFLLVLLFNSFFQPFLVMAAIPFGITGVIAAFGFHGEPFSFTAMMGIIGLSGVVVNDSLVLVSHLNRLKEQNPEKPLKELVASGTADRLRAIVMTTVSTVVALLPLAYGIGGSALFMAPMALALGWGLLFATPLTLLLVPSLYLIADDISKPFRRSAT